MTKISLPKALELVNDPNVQLVRGMYYQQSQTELNPQLAMPLIKTELHYLETEDKTNNQYTKHYLDLYFETSDYTTGGFDNTTALLFAGAMQDLNNEDKGELQEGGNGKDSLYFYGSVLVDDLDKQTITLAKVVKLIILTLHDSLGNEIKLLLKLPNDNTPESLNSNSSNFILPLTDPETDLKKTDLIKLLELISLGFKDTIGYKLETDDIISISSAPLLGLEKLTTDLYNLLFEINTITLNLKANQIDKLKLYLDSDNNLYVLLVKLTNATLQIQLPTA